MSPPSLKASINEHPVIVEQNSNDFDNTMNMGLQKLNLQRQKSTSKRRVAPLNFKRRSISPQVNELSYMINKNIEKEISGKEVYEREVDINKIRQKSNLPPKTRFDQNHKRNNKGERIINQRKSQILMNTLKRSLKRAISGNKLKPGKDNISQSQ